MELSQKGITMIWNSTGLGIYINGLGIYINGLCKKLTSIERWL